MSDNTVVDGAVFGDLINGMKHEAASMFKTDFGMFALCSIIFVVQWRNIEFACFICLKQLKDVLNMCNCGILHYTQILSTMRLLLMKRQDDRRLYVENRSRNSTLCSYRLVYIYQL